MNTNKPRDPNPAAQAYRSSFYDLSQIKQIPIADVCKNMLGIPCITRSGKVWCKTHKERTESTLLHEDTNTFHDFGTDTHGDNIGLVSHVLGIDRKSAIDQIAQAYHIQPINQRKDMDPNELTLWEYEKIGIAGDKATKNFDFDVERQPIERIYAISEKYSMSMNELRKQHPKTYEKVIRQKALPYVRRLRNEYFLEVWSRYQTMCNIGNPSLFFRPDQLSYFEDQIKQLKTAERLLGRAIHGTGIKLNPTQDYEPAKDLEMLSKGEIKPVMGTTAYKDMQDASKANNCAVKYRTVDYDKYAQHMMSEANELFYSAFLSAGRVVIGYLEKDLAQFKPFFDKMRPPQQAKDHKSNDRSKPSPFRKRQEPER